MTAFEVIKKVTPAETEKDVSFAPLAKDLTQSALENNLQKGKMRNGVSLSTRRLISLIPYETNCKNMFMIHWLNNKTIGSSFYRPPLPSEANRDKPPDVQARLSREFTERGCALEFIRREKKCEMEGNLNSKYCSWTIQIMVTSTTRGRIVCILIYTHRTLALMCMTWHKKVLLSL